MEVRKNKYIAFSLWGDVSHYTLGAVRNAELAPAIYPGWHVVVYYDQTVPMPILNALTNRGVRLIDMSESKIYGPFWRFLASDFPDCGHVVFRDTDSRLTKREYKAVEEWIKEDRILHVMRDHPYHEIPFGADRRAILAGMWGIKGNVISMDKVIKDFIRGKEFYYGIDQAFLQQIYTDFQHSQTLHDEFFGGKPFPERRTEHQFIGERIDEFEQPMGEDREILKNFLEQRKPSWTKRLKNIFRK
ncbi:hypothetical protein [Parapedobacter sp. DT-150]|uniref:hypothetical protein n=1 Tax=Parapedobacter sp. DT-150 TaxID=3396162 RepID=UPI003F1AFCCF